MIAFVYEEPNCQLLLVSIPCPMWAHDPPSVDPRKTYLRHTYVCSLRLFSKGDNLLLVIVLLEHFEANKPRTEIFSRVPVPFYGRFNNRYST